MNDPLWRLDAWAARWGERIVNGLLVLAILLTVYAACGGTLSW